jgi:hypothetical protein
VDEKEVASQQLRVGGEEGIESAVARLEGVVCDDPRPRWP